MVNWSELAKTFIGPLIGAAIALGAIWLKELLERRRAIQSWYEERYIREGLDRITSYILTLEYFLSYPSNAPPIPKDMLHFPVEAISRIQIALQTEVFTMSLPMLYQATEFAGYGKEVGPLLQIMNSLASEIRWSIDALRREMLSASIKRRAEIYDFANKPEIKRILKKVEITINEAHKSFQNEARKKLNDEASSIQQHTQADD